MASGHSYKSVSDKFQSDYVDPIFAKGTSRRIYGELFDSSDCILHISDARDPLCTTCESLLQYLKKEKAHKRIMLVMSKYDLVPNWVTVCALPVAVSSHSLCLCRRDIFSTSRPDIALLHSMRHKGSLVQLLCQISRLHSDEK